MTEKKHKSYIRWALVAYDSVIFLALDMLLLLLYGGEVKPTYIGLIHHALLSYVAVISLRFFFHIYSQIWRYGGIQNYINLMISDAIGFWVYFLLAKLLPIQQITFVKMLALVSMNLLGALSMRMVYRYAYKCADNKTLRGRFLMFLLRVFGGIKEDRSEENRKINVAIYGAGNLGVALLNDIRQNKQSPYEVRCFVDTDASKAGRAVEGIKVISEDSAIPSRLVQDFNIQEIIFAIHNLDQEKMRRQYEIFTQAGFKVMNYDVPHAQDANEKASLKEFQIEDLLFRKPIVVTNEKTNAYYKGKTILITGGGGSIGSELCRQVAKMSPKALIILDIYENCAYDVQQEMRIKYGNKINFYVEICSITNKKALRRVFETYHPDIIINAAAHKHVPLMEHNCIEAIENNVFGCKNLLELTEEYNCGRFMMVSTDKAVNPTNVMGATKRMCELMVMSASKYGKAVYTCTRFGNVLGSAGSVIPLFKRQIAAGGPVTLTDKRIIRYFMTIPEASQLVLQSEPWQRTVNSSSSTWVSLSRFWIWQRT
ncbi:MAG: polysaccharide biosynthesis protein [Spirochaetales bacterium]|nr:polysaccharide biosynthesis protein [Candidatus Physcosoma equi]